jgi:hypothetical protein
MTDPIPSPSPDSLDARIDEALIYAFPLWEIARTRHADFAHADPALRMTPNTVRHDRALCDHTSRWITTPNNDTLYSRAWLDLSGGPVRVTVDAQPPGRYWSVALMDAYSNHFAMLGTRLDGVGPVTVTLVGPRHAGPLPAGRVLRTPGDDVWLLGRWIVDGPADLPAAQAMQDRLHVAASGAAHPARVVPADLGSPANLLAVVNEQLARNPPPAADAAVLERCAALGLRSGDTDAGARLAPALHEAWRERLALALPTIRRAGAAGALSVQGWTVRPPELGNFGTNYALRAAVALGGLAALEPIEAAYASRRTDARGEALTGQRRYRLRVPPQGLPIDAFWSLTMYEATRDGRLFFVDNPIGRYAVGDRTAGLRRSADGALEILMQHEPPSDPALRANWLPAPAGPFVLSLRAYLPRPEYRSWQAALPTVDTLA